jgi:hypothetical protein
MNISNYEWLFEQAVRISFSLAALWASRDDVQRLYESRRGQELSRQAFRAARQAFADDYERFLNATPPPKESDRKNFIRSSMVKHRRGKKTIDNWIEWASAKIIGN